ncbi:MAG: VanW family protein, partial [Armatimonadetes bacterium]|nr:VanW family protein [Armatimonadota bacterium]
PGKVGVTLQVSESQAALQTALSEPLRRAVALVVVTQPPSISIEDLENIEVVLGSYSTPFKPGQVSRSHNLQLAISRVNNTVLQPDEEFSVNETVGPRLAKTGYRIAPILRNNELVPGIGGGVCQVTTTVYNAALLANMEMIERRPHSRPAAYCPAGRDATVDYHQIDMRFKNSLNHPILILGGVKGNRLWAKILGKAEDDYDVKLVRTGLSRSGYATKEVPDPELEEGNREIETEGRSGLRVTLIREIYSKDGELIDRQTMHNDVYRAQTKIVRVGTKPTEAELTPADESSSPGPLLSPIEP